MSFRIDTSELDALGRELPRAGPLVQVETKNSLTRSALQIERNWKADAPVMTGTYRRSISHNITAGGGTIRAEIGTNVPYAIVLEEGRAAVTIRPVNAKVLAFQIGSSTVFAREVHQPARPGRQIGAKAFARTMPAILHEFNDVLPKRVFGKLGFS